MAQDSTATIRRSYRWSHTTDGTLFPDDFERIDSILGGRTFATRWRVEGWNDIESGVLDSPTWTEAMRRRGEVPSPSLLRFSASQASVAFTLEPEKTYDRPRSTWRWTLSADAADRDLFEAIQRELAELWPRTDEERTLRRLRHYLASTIAVVFGMVFGLGLITFFGGTVLLGLWRIGQQVWDSIANDAAVDGSLLRERLRWVLVGAAFWIVVGRGLYLYRWRAVLFDMSRRRADTDRTRPPSLIPPWFVATFVGGLVVDLLLRLI